MSSDTTRRPAQHPEASGGEPDTRPVGHEQEQGQALPVHSTRTRARPRARAWACDVRHAGRGGEDPGFESQRAVCLVGRRTPRRAPAPPSGDLSSQAYGSRKARKASTLPKHRRRAGNPGTAPGEPPPRPAACPHGRAPATGRRRRPPHSRAPRGRTWGALASLPGVTTAALSLGRSELRWPQAQPPHTSSSSTRHYAKEGARPPGKLTEVAMLRTRNQRVAIAPFHCPTQA